MKIVVKFLAGVVMTLLYVLVVPYVTDTYITPFIIENVGDSGLAFISTETLIQILILLVTIGFILILGGGAILRWFGVIGVLGMIAAYWLLGDITKATIPVLSIIIVSVALWALHSRNHNKKKSEEPK